MEPPPCVQNAMMKQDKKPFTYTPGGLDLSEIRSPRMARRIERNANYTGAPETPRPPPPQNVGPLPPSALAAMQPQMHVQVFPSGPPPPLPGAKNAAPPPPPPPPPANIPPPPPLQPLPTQKVVTTDNQVLERPDMTKIIPENPMSLLRKTGGPKTKSNFVDQIYIDQPSPQQSQQQWSPPVLKSTPVQQPKSFVDEMYNTANQQSQDWPPVQMRNAPVQSAQQRPKSFVDEMYNTQGGQQNNQHQWSPPAQSNKSPPIQQVQKPQPWSPPIVERDVDQPVKTSTAHLGSLYIPPINQQQQQPKQCPPSPPKRDPQSPQVQSPSTPTLKEAPKPWQKQQQTQELPPWAKRENSAAPTVTPAPAPVTPAPEQRSAPNRWTNQNNQRPPSPKQESHPNAVYITQPLVLQHPGVPPNRQQQQGRVDAQGAKVIPVQIEGVNQRQGSKINSPASPATPGNERSLNRQQSWGNTPTQSNAFKMIQKITNTDEDDEDDDTPITHHSPRFPQQFQQPPPTDQMKKMKLAEGDRNLMNRFKQGNCTSPYGPIPNPIIFKEEEDPRYRGGIIPSRVFRMLDKAGVDDDTYLHNEVDPRYRGPAIPSKAFKLLQSMTDGTPDSPTSTGATVPRASSNGNRTPQVRTIPIQIERDEPPQKYVHPSEQTVPEPKKYTGSSIPSRSFKILQAMTAPDSCANANEVNENNDPSSYSQWGYDSNYPPPNPIPFWSPDYYQYYYPTSSDNEEKNNRQTPVPYWGYYPPPPSPYPFMAPPVVPPQVRASETDVDSARNTPLPFWGYYPYCSPTPTPEDNNLMQNEKEEYNHMNYNQYPPYWDPYYYGYYYGYPPVYSPYPFYGIPSDSDEIGDYSSTDEMTYLGKKFNQRKPEKIPSRATTPKILITPTLSKEYNEIRQDKNEETTDTESDTETEDNDDQNDLRSSQSNGLQTIKSVKDINVYIEDPSNSEDSSESDDNDDADSVYVVEDETVPHQLSIIFEVSEKTDTSRRESSIMSDSTTIADRSDDEEDHEETIATKSPLNVNKELESIVASVLLFDNANNDVLENEQPINFSKEFKSLCLTEIDDRKNDSNEEKENIDKNLVNDNKQKPEVESIVKENNDDTEEEEDWWGILNKDEDDFVPQKKKIFGCTEQSEDSADSESTTTIEVINTNQVEDVEGQEINKTPPIIVYDTMDCNQNNSDNFGQNEEIENSNNFNHRMEVISNINQVKDCQQIENNVTYEVLGIEEAQAVKKMDSHKTNSDEESDDDDDDASSTSSSNSSSSESNASRKISESESETYEKQTEINYSQTQLEEKPELLSIKERIAALRESIRKKEALLRQEQELKINVKDKITAIEVGGLQNKATSTKSSVKSFEEFSEEEADSGVTSDMSRHISDNEEFSELKKMTRYQRAATHSRLYKLLQEVCEDDNNSEDDSNYTKQKEEKNFEDPPRRNHLTLPLKPVSDESFSSSGITSPGSPINDKLVTELIQSMLKRKKGQVFRNLPKEKLQAAAKKILQEELDDLSTPDSSFLSPLRNGTESSTPAQTPQEFYNDYKQYYDTWNIALANENYDILPSKAFKLLQEHSGLNRTGAIAGLLAKCPKILSSKNVHEELLKLIEQAENPESPDNTLEPNEVTSAS